MIAGKLIADFSSVPTEADKAVAALFRMEGGATKATSALNKIQAPASLPQSLTGLSRSLGQVDSILALVGAHIGPEVRALAELGAIATTTSTAMGTMAAATTTTATGIGVLETEAVAGTAAVAALGGATTAAVAEVGAASAAATVALGPLAIAALAVGTAIAAWKFGTAIGEWTGLSDAIGKATAKLMGWGDVAAMSAAARADVLAKASAIAGRSITNLAEAMGITQGAAEDAAAATKDVSDSMDRVNASALNAQDLATWNGEIETLKNDGVLPDLTADINSHNFSMKTLADRYKISTEALQLFAREAAETARIEENNSKRMAELRLAEVASIATLADRKAAAAAAEKKAIYDEVDAITAADKAHHDLGIAADEAQTLAKKKTDEETAALKAQEDAAKDLARAMGNTMEFDLASPEGRAQFLRLNPGASINASADYFQTHSLADAVRDGLVNFYSHYATQGGEGGSGAPSLVGLASRGGGPTVPVTVHVSGIFDPKSQQGLAAAVGTAVSQQVYNGRTG